MADEYSFDVVSKVDPQAVMNAVNNVNREVAVRYDFRGSKANAEWDPKENEITLLADDEMKLRALIDILHSKLAKQSVDLKALDLQKLESALGGTVRQVAKVNQGVSQEVGKKVVADIKSEKFKVTPSIRGDQLRVTSKSKDTLQQVISFVKGKDYGIPLQFENFR